MIIKNAMSRTRAGEICICNGFPRGHYLVWWVKFSLGVRVSGLIRVRVDVRVRVSNVLGSD